jgi:hypothetical protein
MMVLMNDGQSRKPIGDEPHDIQTMHVGLKNPRLPTAGDVSGDAQSSRSSSFIFQSYLGVRFIISPGLSHREKVF